MIRILSVRFSDGGETTIDWIDEGASQKGGYEIHSSVITLAGQEDEQINYWMRELRQDADELLGHTRKMLDKP